MANVRHERKESEITSRVNRVESTATFLVRRAKYENGRKVQDGKSDTVPYTFYQVQETKIQTLGQLRDVLGDLHEHCGIPIASLVADLNHGLEYRGRDALAAGLDPEITEKQRSIIERVRGLVDDGLLDSEMAKGMLGNAGLTTEQADRYLS